MAYSTILVFTLCALSCVHSVPLKVVNLKTPNTVTNVGLEGPSKLTSAVVPEAPKVKRSTFNYGHIDSQQIADNSGTGTPQSSLQVANLRGGSSVETGVPALPVGSGTVQVTNLRVHPSSTVVEAVPSSGVVSSGVEAGIPAGATVQDNIINPIPHTTIQHNVIG